MKRFSILFFIMLVMMSFQASAYWNASFQEGNCLAITNTDSVTIPANATLNFSINTASLIASGKLQSDCDDLRLIKDNLTEINFTTDTPFNRFGNGSCNTNKTIITFKTTAPIITGTNTAYCLYYNNSLATNTRGGERTAFLPLLNQPTEFFSNFDVNYEGDEGSGTDSGLVQLTPTPLNKFLRISVSGDNEGCNSNDGGKMEWTDANLSVIAGISCQGTTPRNVFDSAPINPNFFFFWVLKNFTTTSYHVTNQSNDFGQYNNSLNRDFVSNISFFASHTGGTPTHIQLTYVSYWLQPDTDKISYSLTGNFSLPIPVLSLTLNNPSGTTFVVGNTSTVAYSFTTSGLTSCAITSTSGLSFGLNVTDGIHLFNQSSVPTGSYVWSANCTNGITTLFATTPFVIQQQLVINESIVPLTCPVDSVPNTILFMFLGTFLIGLLFVNMITLRIPVLNLVVGLGIVAYSFTMYGCSTAMGIIVFVIGLMIMASTLLVSR